MWHDLKIVVNLLQCDTISNLLPQCYTVTLSQTCISRLLSQCVNISRLCSHCYSVILSKDCCHSVALSQNCCHIVWYYLKIVVTVWHYLKIVVTLLVQCDTGKHIYIYKDNPMAMQPRPLVGLLRLLSLLSLSYFRNWFRNNLSSLFHRSFPGFYSLHLSRKSLERLVTLDPNLVPPEKQAN